MSMKWVVFAERNVCWFAYAHFMHVLLPRLSLRPVYRTAETDGPVCPELAPRFTVYILRYSRCPLISLGLAEWEACRSHDFWNGADATTVWYMVRAELMIDESLIIDWRLLCNSMNLLRERRTTSNNAECKQLINSKRVW